MIFEVLESRRLLTHVLDLDPLFGQFGRSEALTPNPSGLTVRCVSELRNGKTLIASTKGFYRLNADQSLDSSFGTNGFKTIPIDYEFDEALVAADGGFVIRGLLVGGRDEDGLPLNNNPCIFRYDSEGELASLFGNGGIVETSAADSLVILSNGDLIVGGSYYDSIADTLMVSISSLDSDGSFDRSFGLDGIVEFADPGFPTGITVVGPTGKLLVQIENDYLRLKPDGTPDEFFGDQDTRRLVSLPGFTPLAGQLPKFDSLGNIYLAEKSEINMPVIIRYRADGRIDASFGNQGVLSLDGINDKAMRGFEVLADDTLFVVASDKTGILPRYFDAQGNPFRAEQVGLIPPGTVAVVGKESIWATSEGSILHVGIRPDLQLSDNGTLVVTTVEDDDSVTLTEQSEQTTLHVNGHLTTYSQNAVKAFDVFSGSGNDSIVSSRMISCRINAGAGNDSISTGGADDNIYALSGRDSVNGGDGFDLVNGGSGNDILHGAGGGDTLLGSSGNDLISGGGGKDRILGSYGNDRLYGGNNNDQIDGGPGRDRMDGGEGDDKLFGRNGNDDLTGGGGSDQLFGGKGADVFATLDGEVDFLDGGTDKRDSILSRDPDLDVLISVELL